MPPRRAAFALAFLPFAPVRPVAAEARLRPHWHAFRERFLAPDGRVVDTGNGGISHSEGQGWAMLAAVRADDPATFRQLHGWTMRHLKRPRDELFAWRHRPGRGVEDPNNATDGDLFIAWALCEAADRWGRAEHAAQGVAIARDVLRLLVRPVAGHAVLLPGALGFMGIDGVVLNPSYYAFPALRALAAAAPDPLWLRVAGDGLALLRRGRFGRWGLPPDWLALAREGSRLSPAPGWPARFSYDAVRVPLWLAWAGLREEDALRSPASFWAGPWPRQLPAWADLASDRVAPYPASPGIAAVAQLARGEGRALAFGRAPPPMPDYYSAALSLLVALAAEDHAAG